MCGGRRSAAGDERGRNEALEPLNHSLSRSAAETPTVKAALAMTEFEASRVVGIVGAARSANSATAALIADIFGVALMSYSSTSASLSDKSRYPTFYRTVPPDSIQARALLDICIGQGWNRVTVLHTTSTYGASLNTNFQALAANTEMAVTRVISIQTEGEAIARREALRDDMESIDGNLEKVFLVFATAADGAWVLEIADDFGLLDGKHTFLAVDGVMQNTLVESLAADKKHLARGLLGTRPSAGGTPEYDELVRQWRQKNDSVNFPGSQSSAANPNPVPNVYVPYAYDCVWMYAKAISEVATMFGDENINSTNVLKVLAKIEHTGATGDISFDPITFDRVGGRYDIFNFVSPDVDGELSDSVELRKIGQWTDSERADERVNYDVEPRVTVEQLTSVSADIECGDMEVPRADGSGCEKCEGDDYFDAEAGCVPCPTGRSPNEEGTGCNLDPSTIVLIVFCALLIGGLIGLLVYMYVSKKREQARAAEVAALTQPANVWELVDETQETSNETETAAGIISKLDTASTVTVSVKSGEVPTFGLARGQRMPVMEPMSDTIVIVNRGQSPVNYSVFVPDGGDTFSIEVTPGVGVVKPRSERELTMKFTLRQTMKLDRYLKVQTDEGAVCFPLRFEGEVSQRLDPDEIELFGKPIGDGAFGTVYRGRYRGTAVAVKVLRRQNELGSEQNDNFVKEIELFQKLRNPYIVNFIGASYVSGKLCM